MKAFALGCLTAATLGSVAFAQTKDLRISFWVPPSHALVVSFEGWAKSLAEASGGTLSSTFYPAQQLGNAVDQYDMARDGIAEMTMVAPAYSPGMFPIIMLKELPFLFTNSSRGAKALHEWYLDYVEREMPDVKLCVLGIHHPATLHMKSKEVHVPADLNGTKLRTAGPNLVSYVTAQGASTVQAALPEIRELVERGVVEGITFPWDLSVVNAQDALTYHLDVPMYIGAQLFVMNKDFYASLEGAAKEAVDSHCTPDWSEKLSAPWAQTELAARDAAIANPAHTVYAPSEAELAEWIAAADPIRQKAVEAITARYGLNGDEILSGLKAKLAEHDAGF